MLTESTCLVKEVFFFKNMLNPQRTPRVVIEQVMDKQYKVRYGDNQYTKVATQNMVPVNSQVTEANPRGYKHGQ